jgi:hypothetical protein
MKANHVPRSERLKWRVWGLESRLEESRARKRGNPYYYCKGCGIHDPALYVPGGRHHKNCPYQGLEAQISYFKRLLEEAEAEEA